MNYKKTAEIIEDFIREQTEEFNGGVVGLSGGIDSTVTAYLAVNAIGKNKVYGLVMPCHENKNKDDAIEIAEVLGIGYDVIDIMPVVDAFEQTRHFKEKVTKENLKSRVRMCFLYGFANDENMLVLGTSNKSELETGYFTKYGDGGVDIEPIGSLYKTEVWGLAKFLRVPQKIIDKPPSADLSPEQTDEKDLGMDYYDLDKILRGETKDVESSKIERAKYLIETSKHKKKMPLAAVIER